METKFSSNLLESMKNRNITQKQLAEQLGTTEATISRYVNGDREPKADVIANIATILHTTSDFLLGIEQDQTFKFHEVERLLARNSKTLTNDQKRALINALFGED